MAAAHEEEKAAVEIHTAALGDELAAAELYTVSPVDEQVAVEFHIAAPKSLEAYLQECRDHLYAKMKIKTINRWQSSAYIAE
ncbi:unnamed protein product [Cylicocyclus nassatus]|uniref:Uncharacterized protein n=1 Tax=Cylicocyclus nassatus TaxID=53992 RepID=A0AA36DL21_CYLNA|nr:unnamed protein product [Cylicocyclus nassatus]